MSTLSLPPRLNGNTRATLELRIEALLITNIAVKQKLRKNTLKVFVRWWGQALNEGIYFSPRVVQSLGLRRDSSPSHRGIRVAVFKIVTGKKRFGEYLQDAERLFLEIHSTSEDAKSDEIKVIGYTLIERLNRIIEVNVISEDLDIFDENGLAIGKLRCQLFYEPIESSEVDSCENSQADQMVNKNIRSQSTIPTITLKSKLPIVRSEPCLSMRTDQPLQALQPPNRNLKPKVTFSDKNTEFPVQRQQQDKEQDFERTKSADRTLTRQVSAEPKKVLPNQGRYPSYAKPIKSRVPSTIRAAPINGGTSVRQNIPSYETNFQFQERDDFTAKNSDFIEDVDQSELEQHFPVKRNYGVSSDLSDSFNDQEEVRTENNFDKLKRVEINDICIGNDFDVNNSSEVRRFLLRTSQSIESNTYDNPIGAIGDAVSAGCQSVDESSSSTSGDEIEVVKEPIRNLKITSEPNLDNRPPSPNLPTGRWKLNSERLKEVLEVNQLQIRIRKIRFSPQFSSSFLATAGNSRFDKKAPVKKGPSCEKDQQKISFFVNFSIPPRGDDVTCCSLKRDGKSGKSFDAVEFESKTLHSVKFDQSILDAWFTQSLTFKIHSRSLNQRVPTYLGESRFALKHLLLSQRHSSGQEQKIPIYASKSLMRQMAEQQPQSVTSEIIGDLFVDFAFLSTTNNPRPKVQNIEKNLSARNPRDKIVVTSRTAIKKPTVPPRIVQKGLAAEDCDRVPVRDSNKNVSEKIEAKVILQSLLVISEGKDFTVRDPSIRNLFVSCRFLGSGSLLTSQICWSVESPNFNFRHSIPIELDEAFLEHCCKSNFLILEVWSFSEPKDKLVGVATIPLHQIYVSYQFPKQRELVLSLELPVITVDNWIQVHDVLSGQVVGSIHSVFAVGKESQIAAYLDRIQTLDNRCGTISRNRFPSSDKDSQSYATLDHSSSKAVKEFSVSSNNDSSNNSSAKGTQTDKDSLRVKLTVKKADMNLSQEKIKRPRLFVAIEEARNLPRIKSVEFNHRLPPNVYITLPNLTDPSSSRLLSSKIVMESCCPVWNFSSELELPKDFFTDSKQHLIVKVWHCPVSTEETPTSDRIKDVATTLNPNYERDPIIGFVAVDLSPLTLHEMGFEKICGWYNIMDFVGRCRGQVKVTVKPINVTELQHQRVWTNLESSSDEDTCSSHQHPGKSGSPLGKPATVSHPDALNPVGSLNLQQISGLNSRISGASKHHFVNESKDSGIQPNETSKPEQHVTEMYWKLPEVKTDTDSATKSFLATKLSDLTDMAEKLKARLAQNTNAPEPANNSTRFSSNVDLENGREQRVNSFGDAEPSQNIELERSHAWQSGNSTSFLNYTKNINEPEKSVTKFGSFDTNKASSLYPQIPAQQVTPVRVQNREFQDSNHHQERLVDLSDEEGDRAKKSDLLTFSVSPSGSESEMLPELADINWSVVSPESVRDFESRKKSSRDNENQRSRMGPEGGNPLEDFDT